MPELEVSGNPSGFDCIWEYALRLSATPLILQANHPSPHRHPPWDTGRFDKTLALWGKDPPPVVLRGSPCCKWRRNPARSKGVVPPTQICPGHRNIHRQNPPTIPSQLQTALRECPKFSMNAVGDHLPWAENWANFRRKANLPPPSTKQFTRAFAPHRPRRPRRARRDPRA